MKKKAFILAVVVLCALSSVLLICSVKIGQSLFEENVDALVSDEGGSIFGPMCSQTGNSGVYYMKLCSNCAGSFGHYAMDRVAFCPK